MRQQGLGEIQRNKNGNCRQDGKQCHGFSAQANPWGWELDVGRQRGSVCKKAIQVGN